VVAPPVLTPAERFELTDLIADLSELIADLSERHAGETDFAIRTDLTLIRLQRRASRRPLCVAGGV